MQSSKHSESLVGQQPWRGLFTKVNTLISRGTTLSYVPHILKEGVPLARLESEEAHKLVGE